MGKHDGGMGALGGRQMENALERHAAVVHDDLLVDVGRDLPGEDSRAALAGPVETSHLPSRAALELDADGERVRDAERGARDELCLRKGIEPPFAQGAMIEEHQLPSGVLLHGPEIDHMTWREL